MRFHYLHAADIHLDRSLNGLRLVERHPLALAPRQAFTRLVDEAIEGRAAFLILAGDIYDGAWKDSSTGLFFNQQMGRLRKADIPVFVVYGNHDAQSAMPKTLHPPDNVHVFSSKAPQTYHLDVLNVALHGQSFRQVDVRENLVDQYPQPIPGLLNIGVLHTALEGSPPHAPYAPCTLAQLRAFGYDYWALGHVHGHKVLGEEPWIVFPGNLQGLHINEPGPRGAVRVSVVDGRIDVVEPIAFDVLRWASVDVDLTGASELAEAWRRVALALMSAHSGADGRPLCARVVLIGTTELHGWLLTHPIQRAEEVAGQAAAISDSLIIEQVRVQTLSASPAVQAEATDALADLRGYLEEAIRDPEFLATLQAALMPARSELAEIDPEVHPDLTRLVSGDLKELAELASSKRNELFDRIREG